MDHADTNKESLQNQTKPFEEEMFMHCAQCGNAVSSIKGSKQAVCENCGFRDSCC